MRRCANLARSNGPPFYSSPLRMAARLTCARRGTIDHEPAESGNLSPCTNDDAKMETPGRTENFAEESSRTKRALLWTVAALGLGLPRRSSPIFATGTKKMLLKTGVWRMKARLARWPPVGPPGHYSATAAPSNLSWWTDCA